MTGGLAITLLAALGTALVLGALAHRLGMPAIIGYIAAGPDRRAVHARSHRQS